MKDVKKYIQRKTLIYKTGVEYGDYTINHILGCSHGCEYPCYAYLMKKRFKQVPSYEEWCQPAIVDNTLELLEKELPRFKSKINMLHLCFTTDPFMYGYKEIGDLSLAVIKRVNEENIPCSVLTKGVLPIELSKYSRSNEYGITLISLDENFRRQVEPGAAPYETRIRALEELHNEGFRTWVSIEPYPTPNIIKQDIMTILERVRFADKIIFGRTNYNKEVSAFEDHKNFYNRQAEIVMNFCKERGKDFHIKDGTIKETK